jgi:hypothetical protein
VLSLALGIGATTADFSVINNRLLETAPLKNPDELVRFQSMSSTLGEVPRLYDRATGDDLDAESGLPARLYFSRLIFESFNGQHSDQPATVLGPDEVTRERHDLRQRQTCAEDGGSSRRC